MVNYDPNTRALSARAKLNLGTLGQGSLSEGESPVKASQVSLAQLLGGLNGIYTGRDRLAQPLETGYLLSLRLLAVSG